jgi:hypothetical protein
MKVKVIKVKGSELQAGDLFSSADEKYWDTCEQTGSIGEKVYIRTSNPLSMESSNESIYRIEIEK